MIGIGAFGFNTSVFVGVDFTGSVVKQANIAMTRCRASHMNGSLDSGVGYHLPGPLVKLVNNVLSVFTKCRIEKTGTLIKGPGG
jgi:hypothetical protein